ncbi:hypothetical protein V2J56_12490 [Georgenia sp. MJ206]|uniref:hypothetical protein n=1 Tax=Georgenia wangjunii TaxID=3117730 RepID=UPI002F26491F
MTIGESAPTTTRRSVGLVDDGAPTPAVDAAAALPAAADLRLIHVGRSTTASDGPPAAPRAPRAGSAPVAAECAGRALAAHAFVDAAVTDARATLSDLWSGLIETVTPAVEHAQHVMDVAARAPSDELGWIERARELGWRD